MRSVFDNNFDLLRLLLAGLVVLSHGNAVFETGAQWWLFQMAGIAVDGFFMVSGYLISASIAREFRWKAYCIKRLARIYPLFMCVIALQLVVMLSFATVPVPASHIIAYVAANVSALTFLKPYLGDMVNIPINGSLWTIKIELMFYAALPVYLWLVKRFGLWFVLASWFGAYLYRYVGADLFGIQLARQLPGAMCFFIAGYIMHRYGQSAVVFAKRRPWYVAALLGLCACAGLALPYGMPLLRLLALMVAMYAVAFGLPAIRLRYDISYGLYLIHFPLFVTLRHVGMFENWPILAFIVGVVLLVLLSFLAHIAIERPAIKWVKQKAATL